MSPIAKAIDPGFSTADGDLPTFDYDDSQYVRFSFLDWREESVMVLFRDVVTLKWQCTHELLADEHDDQSYEILNSSWLAAHQGSGALDENANFHHFRFNFNTWGSFEVICAGFRLENVDKRAPRPFWNK